MVNITLSNYNTHSSISHVRVNLNTGQCLLSNNKELAIKQLVKQPEFRHPLLSEPFTPTPHQEYHYEYSSIDELLYSGIFVYSKLIQADNPLTCIFKISPSAHYQHCPFADKIGFSINRYKPAQEFISISQFEALIAQLLGLQFKYSEDILINDQFTIANLPLYVDGDALYQTNEKLIALLKTPTDFSRYDIRYITPEIGFGLFSKTIIKEGDIISFYTGIKTIEDPPSFNFSFIPKQDCLMMQIDACQHGNITRFINHAPKKSSSNRQFLIEANVESTNYCINGFEVVLYTARRDILNGEQLLVDYGTDYFENAEMLGFLTNGRIINTHKKFTFSNWQKKLSHLRIMAFHGIKKARIYLIARILIIFFIIFVLLQGISLLV